MTGEVRDVDDNCRGCVSKAVDDSALLHDKKSFSHGVGDGIAQCLK